MLFFGHIGPAAWIAQRLRLHVIATMVFAILPDLVDKPLFVWGLAPYTRFIAHTVLFLAVVVVVLDKLGRMQLARAALVGIGSHFVLDLRHFIPLLYPFVQYDWPLIKYGIGLDSITLLFEAIGLVFIAGAWEDLKREASVFEYAFEKKFAKRS